MKSMIKLYDCLRERCISLCYVEALTLKWGASYQLWDCNLTHAYFCHSSQVLPQLHFFSYRCSKWCFFGPSDYPVMTTLTIIAHAQKPLNATIVTIKTLCIGPKVSLHLISDTWFLWLILYVVTSNSSMYMVLASNSDGQRHGVK